MSTTTNSCFVSRILALHRSHFGRSKSESGPSLRSLSTRILNTATMTSLITSTSLQVAGGRPECSPQIILSTSWNLKIKSSLSTSTRLALATLSPSSLSSLPFFIMRRPFLLRLPRCGPGSLKISCKSDENLVQYSCDLTQPIR